MATGCRHAVNGRSEAKVANDVAGFEREMGVDKVSDGLVSKLTGTKGINTNADRVGYTCLLYTSPSPRDS